MGWFAKAWDLRPELYGPIAIAEQNAEVLKAVRSGQNPPPAYQNSPPGYLSQRASPPGFYGPRQVAEQTDQRAPLARKPKLSQFTRRRLRKVKSVALVLRLSPRP